MKKIIQHALSPLLKDPGKKVSDDDFFRAYEQAIGFINETYAVYTGVLDSLYYERRITSSHKAIKIMEYKKERDRQLSLGFQDVESFKQFYYQCRQDLETAVQYAKLQTGVGE
jgi:hypothetical protein